MSLNITPSNVYYDKKLFRITEIKNKTNICDVFNDFLLMLLQF